MCLVVSHSNSTSNHNGHANEYIFAVLFLIPILHQTTTPLLALRLVSCCFSFQFYIKPQLAGRRDRMAGGCFSFQFYIKPQRAGWHRAGWRRLFLIPILHQTTTIDEAERIGRKLFLIPILHQTTTSSHFSASTTLLFLIPILHQTTTDSLGQHSGRRLFLIPILHQTTTRPDSEYLGCLLFLIPILHQTTTSRMAVIHILHVTHMTPMHKTSCRTPGKLVGCNFVFQRAIYQKNSSC